MPKKNQFSIYIGGEYVSSAKSLDAANDKLTDLVVLRAMHGNSSPVTGEIHDSNGKLVEKREFGEAIYG